MALPASVAVAYAQPTSSVRKQQALPDTINNIDIQNTIDRAEKTMTRIIDLLDRIQKRTMLYGRTLPSRKPPPLASVQQSQLALNSQLIAALQNNDTKKAITLVNQGADPDTLFQATPLTVFAIACGVVPYDEGGIGLSETERRKRTTFTEQVQGIRSENIPLIQTMLAHHATVDRRDGIGRTPLMGAIHSGRTATVSLLLEYGADVNAGDYDFPNSYYRLGGHTPLVYAVQAHRLDLARLLFQHGADVNVQDHLGFTPLMFAAESGHLDMVLLLLNCGAKINTCNVWGWNALYCALNWDAPKETIQQLLQHRADPNIETNAYMTPLMVAGSPDIVALLKKYGAKR